MLKFNRNGKEVLVKSLRLGFEVHQADERSPEQGYHSSANLIDNLGNIVYVETFKPPECPEVLKRFLDGLYVNLLHTLDVVEIPDAEEDKASPESE